MTQRFRVPLVCAIIFPVVLWSTGFFRSGSPNVGRIERHTLTPAADLPIPTHEPLLSRPKLCLGASLHNEAESLPEWMEFYLAQGVDFFCLVVDSRSTDDTLDLLKFYEALGVAEVRSPPVTSVVEMVQERMKSLDRCIRAYNCEWTMTADSDEWTYPNPLYGDFDLIKNRSMRDFLFDQSLQNSTNGSNRGIWPMQWQITQPQPYFETAPSLVNAFFFTASPEMPVKVVAHRKCLKDHKWGTEHAEHIPVHIRDSEGWWCPFNKVDPPLMRSEDYDAHQRSTLPYVALHCLSRSRIGFKQRQERLASYPGGEIWSKVNFWDLTRKTIRQTLTVPQEFKSKMVLHLYQAYNLRRYQLRWYCSQPRVFYSWGRCKNLYPFGASIPSLRRYDDRLSLLDEFLNSKDHQVENYRLPASAKVKVLSLSPRFFGNSMSIPSLLPSIFRQATELSLILERVATSARALHDSSGTKSSLLITSAPVCVGKTFPWLAQLQEVLAQYFEGIPGLEVLALSVPVEEYSETDCDGDLQGTKTGSQCGRGALNGTDGNAHCNQPLAVIIPEELQPGPAMTTFWEGRKNSTLASLEVIRLKGQLSTIRQLCLSLPDGACRKAAFMAKLGEQQRP